MNLTIKYIITFTEWIKVLGTLRFRGVLNDINKYKSINFVYNI